MYQLKSCLCTDIKIIVVRNPGVEDIQLPRDNCLLKAMPYGITDHADGHLQGICNQSCEFYTYL